MMFIMMWSDGSSPSAQSAAAARDGGGAASRAASSRSSSNNGVDGDAVHAGRPGPAGKRARISSGRREECGRASAGFGHLRVDAVQALASSCCAMRVSRSGSEMTSSRPLVVMAPLRLSAASNRMAVSVETPIISASSRRV